MKNPLLIAVLLLTAACSGVPSIRFAADSDAEAPAQDDDADDNANNAKDGGAPEDRGQGRDK